MKVYEFNQIGVENLAAVSREIPRPGQTGVLLKIHAVSLNYRDLMVVKGQYNPRMKFPVVPLSDCAGEVVELGGGVTKWKIGDRVCPIFCQGWAEGPASAKKSKTSLGGGSDIAGVLSEYAVFGEEGLVKIPSNLSLEQASTLPCAAVTAWNALAVSGKLKAGETVLTLGTGGVSVFAIQFAKLFGAKVLSTSGSDEKLARAAELGADETINYRDVLDWDKAVLELTGNTGVDHVVEVGGAGTIARSVNAVKVGGHIAVIGVLSGGAGFNPVSLLMKQVRMQGIFVGSRQMFEDMNRAIECNGLTPVIDKSFAFDEIGEAFRFMERGAHFGKIVVNM